MAMRTLGSVSVLAALFLVGVLHAETRATNGEGSATSADSTSAGSCRLSGVAAPELGVPILDKNGQSLARFGGVALPVVVADLPEQANGRLHVITGGSGRLSLDGFVDASALPLYVTTDVPVVAGQLSIAKGSKVEYLGRKGSQLRVKLTLSAPLADSFEATVPCESVSVELPKTEPSRIPGHARGYYMKNREIALREAPGADASVVTTLHLGPDSRGVLFFGDKRVGGFVHVLYRQGVSLDGWLSVSDLELLPKGELVDQTSLKPASRSASKLSVPADAKLYRAPSDLALHGKADPKLEPIGVVPRTTELYVLDVVVGWANVLPKQLDVVPLDERRFWVRASELGL